MDYKFTFEDGSEAIYHSDLYHGDHKYIRRFMENGKWVYEYAKDAAKKAASGAKWLGEAIKNDLTGKTTQIESNRDVAEWNKNAYRRMMVKGNRNSRNDRQNLQRRAFSGKETKDAAGFLRTSSEYAQEAKRGYFDSRKKQEQYEKELESMPSLKRKIAELLNKKKKK